MYDQQIIEVIRSHKTDKAFQELYDHFPSIRKMIRSNGGNSDDASDIFQEALIILCKKIRETDFKLTSSLSTYLYGICNFLWKDELKKRKKQHYTELLPGYEQIETEIKAFNETETQIKMAEKAISELGNRCQDILRLFYFDAMSMQQIALKLGYSSENVAKNQKYKCLETAREHLKKLRKLSIEQF